MNDLDLAQAREIVGDLLTDELTAAVAAVKRTKPRVAPGSQRQLLRRAATALTKAHAALQALPIPTRRAIGNTAVLPGMAATATALAVNLKVTASGGHDDAQKQRAAKEALQLLGDPDCIDRKATLTESGSYITLATLLYSLATGRDADLTRACRQYVKVNYPDYGAKPPPWFRCTTARK